jgi:hypothetical protein
MRLAIAIVSEPTWKSRMEEPDLIVIYERWNETKESFERELLLKPFYKRYLSVLERLGVERKIHRLETHYAWRAWDHAAKASSVRLCSRLRAAFVGRPRALA